MLFYHDFKAAEAQRLAEEPDRPAVRAVSQDEVDALYAQSERQVVIIKRMRAALMRLADKRYPPQWVKRIAREGLGPEETKLLRKRAKPGRVGDQRHVR